MSNGRFYRVGLGSDLRIRACGAYGTEEPLLRWSQPSGTWQAMLLCNPARLTLNGENREVGAWCFVIAPPGARCELIWLGNAPFVYLYFGFVPDQSQENTMALPQLTDLSSSAKHWDFEFRKGLTNLHVSALHVGSVARSMLWSVTLPAASLRRNVYVAEAERLIEAEKGPRMKVAELAKAVGLSQAQLSRLFVAEHGTTPLQFIRTAQAHRAQQLLSGTVEPIKRIAATCGFPDVHTFNRFVRARLGASPREIRAGMGTVDVFQIEEYRQRNDLK